MQCIVECYLEALEREPETLRSFRDSEYSIVRGHELGVLVLVVQGSNALVLFLGSVFDFGSFLPRTQTLAK